MGKKLKIAVTSKNPVKINAVKNVYKTLGIGVEVVGYKTNSGIDEQPVNESTYQGAINRRKDLVERIKDLDIIISIENGIFEENKEWVDRAVVVYYNNRTNKEYVSVSGGVIFPKQYVDEARKLGFDKHTVGSVIRNSGIIKTNIDEHSYLSGKSRQNYLEECLGKLIRESEGI